MTKILLIGSGAREHAIARAVNRSAHSTELYCFASSINPGIVPLSAGYLTGKMNDSEGILRFAQNHAVDFAIVGPEAPLAEGVVDALATVGIASIGPTKQLAQIETSKGFTRDLLSKYDVPGMPKYQCFDRVNADTEAFLASLGEYYVIKADGLMGGKGVKVAGDHLHSHTEALEYCREINGPFVIEEKMVGPEFSLISFCDGEHLAHMPAVQDHKRAYENDTGPNTGGMGSYSDANHHLPFLHAGDIAAAERINELTAQALKQAFGHGYKGILYGGFMRTKHGVKLIEYNARFGDPEAINLLSILDTDFVEICQAILDGTLDKLDVNFQKLATVVKYVVPEGYPDTPVKGEPIDLSQVERPEQLFFAAIDQQDQKAIMTGSRAIGVLGKGENIAAAEQAAEAIASKIQGPVFYRKDIGTAELIQQRIDLMEQIA